MSDPTAATLDDFMQSLDARPRPEPYTYAEIPNLKQLIPANRGRPGVTYLQVALPQLKQAQNQGFTQIKNSQFYTIRGPKGAVECALFGEGRPIPGMHPGSGARVCIVDSTILELTGLPIPEGLRIVHIVKPDPKPEVHSSPKPTNGNAKPTAVSKE